MTLVSPRRRSRKAGRSALRQFRARRRRILRENWRDWLLIVTFIVCCLAVAVWLQRQIAGLVFAVLAGAGFGLAVFGWMLGGNVSSLPWLRGAIGEQQTEEALRGLDTSWRCEHDIVRPGSNWDHVLIGPPGVFLLDSKLFTPPSSVRGDALVAGRSSYPGAGFRGAALNLHQALTRSFTRKLWAQAVVVIWSEFEQRCVEESRVVYIHGSELLDWLRSQPGRLSADDCGALFDAVRQMSDA
jgi:Nuclease-related domain